VPKPDGSLSAVVVSGGKQYRVAPGDQVLVDRLPDEPGSSVKLGRVLLLHDGDKITVGTPGVEGVEVEAKVLAHRRGPRIDVLRYKSKKRVRVHRGARADLTAVEILPFVGDQFKAKPKADEAGETAEAEAEGPTKPTRAARKPRATKAAKEGKETD
jgi:large subunit ribosomal protein L21